MGTTVVGALFSPKKNRMYIGHVGDSRAYRVRAGQISQMTRDHSLVNDYLSAMPELTEEQRSELPRNVITRALGMQDHVSVDLQSDESVPGDVYVLCSDGLSGMIEDGEILQVVSMTSDLEEACRRLVRIANEHGGEDNITAVLVRIEEGLAMPDLAGTPTEIKPPPPLDASAATADTPPAGVPAIVPDQPNPSGSES
jgi:protein phosphatase